MYKLDIHDCADGQECVSFNLAQAYLELHIKTMQTKPILMQLSEFAFGHNAMVMMDPGIETNLKLQAIKRVQDSLKAAWKVQ